MKQPIAELVAREFAVQGAFLGACPYGSGHINDTYVSQFGQADGTIVRYIHQRINTSIFSNVDGMMDNIKRVTEHLRDKFRQLGLAPAMQVLTIVPTREGQTFLRTENSDCWRTYAFIEHARTYDAVERPEHVFQAGCAFGLFQKLLADLPGPRLVETISRFGDTQWRLEQFLAALQADVRNRAESSRPEIDFVLARQEMLRGLTQLQSEGSVPERIAHYDAKFNNVMMDEETNKAKAVIDLDTVMPGTVLYDFGDASRIATSTAAEDERDLTKVNFSMERFDLLARGYLSSADEFLTDAERDNLAFAARAITMTVGVRFLTDFLSGDVYFKTHREGHNLDRCRTQFKMVAEMERRQADMESIVACAAEA